MAGIFKRSAALVLPRVKRLLWGREEGFRARIRRRIVSALLIWGRPQSWSQASAAASTAADDLKKSGDEQVRDEIPQGFVPVLSVGELGPGEITEVVVNESVIVLCNVQGTLFAVQGQCPHAQGPLGEGHLEGTTLTCPLHGWDFDLRSRQCGVDPTVMLTRYDVLVRDQTVLLRI